MSDTMTATADQWMQFYQQPLMDGPNNLQVSAMEGFSDATIMTTSSSPSPTILSPSSSYTTSPKAMNNVSKTIRRRSRASKRTPTTLLNANTTNFRALVQQFTGCPSKTAMSFGVYKGPITLNFQQGRRQQIQDNTARTLAMAAAAPFGNTSYNSEVHQQQQLADQQQLLRDHQQQHQESGHNNSFDHSTHFLSNSGNSSKPNMELSDGLLVDHNYSLHDLMNNAFFSNDMIKNDGYFM